MRLSEPVSRRGAHSSKTQGLQPNKEATTTTTSSPISREQKQQQSAAAKALLRTAKTMRKHSPYVVQGLYYFVRHKVLWKKLICPIFWSLLFAIAAFCVLLPVAFIPQAILLSGVMTPWAGVPLALILALLELLLIIMIFSAIVLLPITDSLFDQVLILRGHQALVEADNGSACCGCCSIVGVSHLIISICTLPLNLIPIVGTVLWLFINGRLYTWDVHSHYHYELKGRNFKAQREFVRKHWKSYHFFGMQAMALELIPIAGMFFIFTNCVGAALWAADWEDRLLAGQTESSLIQGETTGSSTTTTSPLKDNQHFPNESTALPAAKVYGP